MRAVVFAERVATLRWLSEHLPKALKLKPENIAMLHGGLSDVEQQEIVDSFKLETSPIRVLVTGDVASEGVNLHAQCHHLIHYDIPWSLIRIEQRNGRIDRYGQKHPPVIASLILEPSDPDFSGDLRVLSRLLERENQAHSTLGDVASLMGKHSVSEEESVIRNVLARKATIDDEVRSVDDILDGEDLDAFFAQFDTAPPSEEHLPEAPRHSLPDRVRVEHHRGGEEAPMIAEREERDRVPELLPRRQGRLHVIHDQKRVVHAHGSAAGALETVAW